MHKLKDGNSSAKTQLDGATTGKCQPVRWLCGTASRADKLGRDDSFAKDSLDTDLHTRSRRVSRLTERWLCWPRPHPSGAACSKGCSGVVKENELQSGAVMLRGKIVASIIGVLNVLLLFCLYNMVRAASAATVAENTHQTQAPPTANLFLSHHLPLWLVEVSANDRRNRRGSSLARSCSLDRFQGSGPPKPTNKGRRTEVKLS